MIDNAAKEARKKKRGRIQNRVHVTIDEDNYEYYPEQKQVDFYDEEVHQRVAAYCRVSTDSDEQQFSFHLQKKYYEDYVAKHGNWELIRVYADEGKSGTDREKRPEFNEMIDDCFDNKIDLVVTKSVSRFARNVVDCISLVRNLQEQKHPVGVFFESECIFSLNEDSQMALTFIATMAEEESHIRSRSMETSLRMRLDNGIPLTPKLLGYTHDCDGNLVINPEEAPTVKLAFYMHLYGYSTQQIADSFNEQERKSYLGNVNKWTSSGIVQILRNERHCGDVLTRKTYTPDYRKHLSKKNRGQRPQSRYFNHHEAIISRDDFNAVQKMLDNAKYGNKSLLPELRVIDSGLLKGFVSINPRWAAFKDQDYIMAAQSVYRSVDDEEAVEKVDSQPIEIRVEAGDFDLRGFEITRSEFFDTTRKPAVTFSERRIKFNVDCVRKFGANNRVELLVNPVSRKFAVRPTDEKNRNSVVFSKLSGGVYQPREVAASAFIETLFSLFGWNIEYKYRIIGSLLEKEGELAYVFDVANSEAFFKSYILPNHAVEGSNALDVQPFLPSGKRIRAIPEEWTNSFGRDFYLHELDVSALEAQSEEDWELRLEGRLFESGKRLNVTGFTELRQYLEAHNIIKKEDVANE